MRTHEPPPSFRALLKWPVIVPLLLLYAGISLLAAIVPGTDSRRRIRIRTSSFFALLAIRLLGVRVSAKHRERLSPGRGGRLIVANHVSYVDVLAISALMPAVFITSVELGNTLLLGTLARLGGSLFVERRKASGLKREIHDIARLLSRGFPVVLFPEGTTSNGDSVHPFKRSLFDAARGAGVDVLPLCLRYSRINDAPVTPENRDDLYYYGGAAFSRHFPAFLGLRSVELVVTPMRLIKIRDAASRKDLAEQAHREIANEYGKQMI